MNSPAVAEPRTHRLSRRVLLGYGIGSLGTGIYSSTPGVLLLFFMTDTLGIPASLAALGVSLPKLWDMLADPVVGGLSDRTRSRWGRRRPWLLGGSLLMLVSYIFLFTVPHFESMYASFLYVTGMFALSATAYAIFAVPYTAMAAEMSDSSQERVRIMAYRMTLVRSASWQVPRWRPCWWRAGWRAPRLCGHVDRGRLDGCRRHAACVLLRRAGCN